MTFFQTTVSMVLKFHMQADQTAGRAASEWQNLAGSRIKAGHRYLN